MNETMEWILSNWEKYWGEGYYQYLLLVAVIYLLIRIKKREAAKKLIPYLAMVLFVFFCPITAEIIRKCIGGGVYWRVLWMLPLIPLIAFAGASFVREFRTPVLQVLLVAMLLAVVALSGKSLWQVGNYEKVHNYQQVPDEVAQICDLINNDRGEEAARLATDDFVASYVRVYDPSIDMPYGRARRGARSKNSRRLYQEMTDPTPNYKRIARLARNRHCNYLAVSLPSEQKQSRIEKYGYRLLAMVNEYGVFVLEK